MTLTKVVNVKDVTINKEVVQDEIENDSKKQIEQKIKNIIEGMRN